MRFCSFDFGRMDFSINVIKKIVSHKKIYYYPMDLLIIAHFLEFIFNNDVVLFF